MTLSKLKLGAVLASVAVGCSWVAFASDPKPPIAPPAAKADPAKSDAKPGDKPAMAPVATVNGEDISRAEFGEYLIRKYGAKEIELFVNQRIIQDAAAEKDIRLPADEVVAAFEADAKGLGMSRDEFVKTVLPKYGKTENEWWTEVLTPRLILEKLLREEVKVTDDDLEKLFERKYGEQRKVEFVDWGQKAPGSAERPGVVPPIGRYTSVGGEQALHDAIFKLKLNEVSEAIDTTQGRVTVKLIEIIPPQKNKKFEDEKASLRAEATREKVQAATPKLFAKLKEEAKPVYHIKPAPKTYYLPLPVKK